MISSEMFTILLQIVPAPMGVLAVYVLAQVKFKKLDEIDSISKKVSILLINLDHMEKEQVKIEVRLDEHRMHREEFIILKSDVKAQWGHLLDVKKTVEGLLNGIR